ncbi:YdeI family protein [Cellulomonas sp. P22]|uniref:YdeI family protein n=1 Tax=Cellulomonas sp. P22 TaxID=3373189 RepID=UPI00378D2619
MVSTLQETSEELVVADHAAWRAWLDSQEDTSGGVWLLLAKKGTVSPTALTYAEALDEALCSGWIDGQKKGNDAATFRQRFTPRRPRSMWSVRNVEHVARLTDEGRMRPRGVREVDRAKADGRWDRAYAGAATAEVPDDLTAALHSAPGAQARFDALSGQDRYTLLHRLMTAPNATVRTRRLDRLVEMLSRDDTVGSAH